MSFEQINIPENLDKTAIVVIGYNRVDCLRWLTASLLKAKYEKSTPLVFSIDCSGCTEVYDFVNNFEWPYGDKYVRIQKERLGLKRHIYECGDVSQYFKAVIILEDDTFVTSGFYSFYDSAVDYYKDDKNITCISGYLNRINGYAELPFDPLYNGNDVIAMQEISSTGECFTQEMWREFRQWLSIDCHTSDDYIDAIDMQPSIKKWKRAWTKYYNAYMVETNKYCIYPIISVVTNCGAIGEHSDSTNTFVQTNIEMGLRRFDFSPFADLTKYDIFFNNIDIYNYVGISKDDLCIDLYGTNPNIRGKKYLLSIKNLPYKVERSFGLNFRAPEINVMLNIPGGDIKLYNTAVSDSNKSEDLDYTTIDYFLHGFNPRYIRHYIVKWCLKVLKHKIFN